MTKDKEKEIQKRWCDSTLDMDEFRKWDVKKQLEAISDFAKSTYSFQKELRNKDKGIIDSFGSWKKENHPEFKKGTTNYLRKIRKGRNI